VICGPRTGYTETLLRLTACSQLFSFSRTLPAPAGPSRDRFQGPRRRGKFFSWLSQPPRRDARRRSERDGNPGRRDPSCSTYVCAACGYGRLWRASWPSCRHFAADACESYPRARLHAALGAGQDERLGSLPEDRDRIMADYALRELRWPRHRHPPGDYRLDHVWRPIPARLSAGRTLPTRTVVWTASSPAADPQDLACRWTSAAASTATAPPCGCGGDSVLGDRRQGMSPRRPTRARHCPRRPHAGPPVPGRRTIAGRARHRHAVSARFTASEPPSATSPATRRSQDRRPHLRWLPRLVAARDLPHEPIPAARQARAVLDWTAVCPSARQSPRSLDRRPPSDRLAGACFRVRRSSPIRLLVQAAPEPVGARGHAKRPTLLSPRPGFAHLRRAFSRPASRSLGCGWSMPWLLSWTVTRVDDVGAGEAELNCSALASPPDSDRPRRPGSLPGPAPFRGWPGAPRLL